MEVGSIVYKRAISPSLLKGVPLLKDVWSKQSCFQIKERYHHHPMATLLDNCIFSVKYHKIHFRSCRLLCWCLLSLALVPIFNGLYWCTKINQIFASVAICVTGSVMRKVFPCHDFTMQNKTKAWQLWINMTREIRSGFVELCYVLVLLQLGNHMAVSTIRKNVCRCDVRVTFEFYGHFRCLYNYSLFQTKLSTVLLIRFHSSPGGLKFTE